MAENDQGFKKELRKPEPTNHPDPRMHIEIGHPSLRIETPLQVIDGKLGKKVPKLAEGGNH